MPFAASSRMPRRIPSASVSPTLATPSEATTTRSMPFSRQRPAGLLVAQPEAGLEVGRAARLEPVDRAQDRPAGRRPAWTARTSRASFPNATTATRSFGPSSSTRMRKASFTSSSRPSRAIEPDVSMTNVSAASWRCRSRTSRAWRPIRTRISSGPVNGRRAAVDGDRERVVPGGAIALVEGVDPFLDPHTGGIRAVAVLDVALGDGIRRGVDVEGEGGDAVLARVNERVDAVVLVGHPVIRGRLRVGRRGRRGGGGRRVGLGWRRSLRGVRATRHDELHAVATRATAARDRSGLRMAQPPCREPVGDSRPRGRGRRSGARRSRIGCHEVRRRAAALTPDGVARFPVPVPGRVSPARIAPSWLRIRAVAPQTESPSTA